MQRLEIESVEFPLLEEQRPTRDKWHFLLQNSRKAMRILVHILLIIDAFFVLYYLLLITQKAVIGRVLLALVSLLGGILLAYGLYGQKRKGHILYVYAIVFHVLPAFFVLISFIIFIFNREQSIAEYKQHFPHVNATMFTIQLVLEDVVAVGYHVVAAWIVLKYKNFQREVDESF